MPSYVVVKIIHKIGWSPKWQKKKKKNRRQRSPTALGTVNLTKIESALFPFLIHLFSNIFHAREPQNRKKLTEGS